MAHSMSLNNRISCVVGILIFGFNKYWQTVFTLIKLNMSPTFKQFLQAETDNTEKKKSYYQICDVKRIRAFNKQAMMKYQIYEKNLQDKVGCITLQEYAFKKFLSTWTKQKHSPIKINWKERIRTKEEGAGVAPSSTYELTQMIALWGFLIKNPKRGYL